MWNSNHYWLGILFEKYVYRSKKKKNGRKNRFIIIIIIDTVNAFMSLSLFCFNTNINYWSSLLLWECPLCISSQFFIHFFSNVYHAFVYRALSVALFNDAGFILPYPVTVQVRKKQSINVVKTFCVWCQCADMPTAFPPRRCS